jgi:hypothetical protein
MRRYTPCPLDACMEVAGQLYFYLGLLLYGRETWFFILREEHQLSFLRI